jgi:hypothetical protein
MLILNSRGGWPSFSARSLATHLAGSQYMTWLSFSAVRTRMFGYGRGARLVYGQYVFMYS